MLKFWILKRDQLLIAVPSIPTIRQMSGGAATSLDDDGSNAGIASRATGPGVLDSR